MKVALRSALGIVVLAGGAAAGDIHVPADQPTIQAAIDAAANGDTVVVADGTYTGAGNRDLDFGGRLITVRSANGPTTTIIDCQAAQLDPHRAFDFHSGETSAARVEGFTIRGGIEQGGAIRCNQASPTIEDCVLRENSTTFSSLPFGGAVSCRHASPRFVDCDFLLNHSSESGGAVACEMDSPAEFSHCAFRQNSASDGGAVFIHDSAPRFEECGFDRNDAGHFGGAIHNWSSDSTFVDCGFFKNHAVEGGGFYTLGGTSDIGGCSFDQNTAGSGGATYQESDHTTIHACSFTGNTAPSGRGGALYFDYETHAVIENNLFVENVARYGGAVSCKGFTEDGPVLDRNLFESNHAVYEFGSYGGAVVCSDFAKPVLTRNIFRHNTVSPPVSLSIPGLSSGGAIYVDSAQPIIGGAPGMGNLFEDNAATPGADLFGVNLGAPLDARYNTFTVAPATAFYVQPLEGFDVSGAEGLLPPILHDVVVSPSGVDQDGGDGPFKTLRFVTSRVAPSPGNPITVHLEPGTYSPSTTGEQFPIILLDGLTIAGAAGQSSVLDAESADRVLLASHIGSATVVGTTIRGGLAGIGGGLYCDASGLILAHNRITQNVAIWGGGLACTGPTSPEIVGNVIEQNQVYDSPYFAHLGAGAFFADGSTALFRDNLVVDNTTDDYGGAIACNNDAKPVIRNATIRGNTAQTGGGIVAWNNSVVTVSDSILWGNHAPTDPEISLAVGSSIIVSRSCVAGGWAGTDNIDTDPLFTGADGALSAGSPCIDAGDPASNQLGTDAVGNPRRLDGDLDGVIVIDMGAEEFGNVHLDVSGQATPGGKLAIETTGKPGLPVTLFFGAAAGSQFHPLLGELGIDFAQPWRMIAGFAVIPGHESAVVPPTLPTPLTIYVQAVALDLGVPAGNVSNVVELTFE